MNICTKVPLAAPAGRHGVMTTLAMAPLCRRTSVFTFFTSYQRKKTAGAVNLKFRYICTVDYSSLAPECHLWHRFDWEGGGGDVEGAIALQN
eukprot:2058132-Ditylum_brightwellii.AAC.1